VARGQRLKVLRDLWEIGGGNPDQKMREWNEILRDHRAKATAEELRIEKERERVRWAGVHADRAVRIEAAFRPIQDATAEKVKHEKECNTGRKNGEASFEVHDDECYEEKKKAEESTSVSITLSRGAIMSELFS